jgi:hypothetical protein
MSYPYRGRGGNHLVAKITTSILGSAVALSAIYVMLRTLPELMRYLRMRRM